MLICSFHQFGNVKVEWPGKEAISQPKGYAYIIFENEMQVMKLLFSIKNSGVILDLNTLFMIKITG